MTKEKAWNTQANGQTTSKNDTDETRPSQAMRILEHLRRFGRLTTLDARRMGIMHPGMRVCELRKHGREIDTGRTYQADDTGAVHRVAVYIWRGERRSQGDLFGEAANG